MGWRGSNSHPTVPRTVSFSLSEVLSGAFTPGRGLHPPLPISSLWLEIRRSSLGSVFLCPLLRLHLHRRAESVSSLLPPCRPLPSSPLPRPRPCSMQPGTEPDHVTAHAQDPHVLSLRAQS